jgi:outer membrane cobalamin receptor
MTGSSSYWMPENISSAIAYGLDLTCKSNIFRNTSILASYSLSITENYNESFSQDHQGKPLLYSPKYSCSFEVQTILNRSTFKMSTKIIGDRVNGYNWPDDNILPNYFTTHVSYKYNFPLTQKLETDIYLKSENIFDTQYQSVYGFPVPGHSYSITMTIKEIN